MPKCMLVYYVPMQYYWLFWLLASSVPSWLLVSSQLLASLLHAPVPATHTVKASLGTTAGVRGWRSAATEEELVLFNAAAAAGEPPAPLRLVLLLVRLLLLLL
eukprot:Trichotokara_eunicae@DN8898_c0_g1_i1.p1